MSRTPAKIAAFIVAAEAIGVLYLALLQVLALVQGDVATVPSALALIVLTLIIGAGTAAFAYGIWNGHTWGRSGATVAQLMVLAVAIGAATGQFAHPLLGAVLAVPAIIALVAIFKDSKAAAQAEARARAAEAGEPEDA